MLSSQDNEGCGAGAVHRPNWLHSVFIIGHWLHVGEPLHEQHESEIKRVNNLLANAELDIGDKAMVKTKKNPNQNKTTQKTNKKNLIKPEQG